MTKDIIGILNKNIKQKTKCKKKGCKVNRANIKTIFDPENDGIKNEWLKRKLPVNSGNSAICDCIIVCKSGKVLVVEILCGTLTKYELDSKTTQIEHCKIILQILRVPFEKAFLLYETRDKKSLKTKFWQQKINDLFRENIVPKQLKGKAITIC